MFDPHSRDLWTLDSSVSDAALGSLFDPWGDHVIGQVHARLAAIYGVPRVFVSTNGTTTANALALATLVGPRDQILLERDCHISMPQALALFGTTPRWLVPAFDAHLGINLASSPRRLEAALDAHPGARAVALTSPKYFGVSDDLRRCVEICHARDVLVLIDEAHGALNGFHPELPPSAVAAGADLVTQSIHKSTEALSQGSVILINNEALCRRFLHVLNGTPFVSTSFNYGIVASVEEAVVNLSRYGGERLGAALQLAARLRHGVVGIRGLATWDASQAGRDGFRRLDPLRVTIDVSGLGWSGLRVEEELQGMQPAVIAELGDIKNLLLLVTHGNTAQDIDTILAHLARLAAEAPGPAVAPKSVPVPATLPERRLTPRQAFWAVAEGAATLAPAEVAVGQVSGQSLAVYPPGNAIIVAGEVITEEACSYLTTLAGLGAHLKGAVAGQLDAEHQLTHFLVIPPAYGERHTRDAVD